MRTSWERNWEVDSESVCIDTMGLGGASSRKRCVEERGIVLTIFCEEFLVMRGERLQDWEGVWE